MRLTNCPRCGLIVEDSESQCFGCYLDLERVRKSREKDVNLDRPEIGPEPNRSVNEYLTYSTIIAGQKVKVKRFRSNFTRKLDKEVKSTSSGPVSIDDKFRFRV